MSIDHPTRGIPRVIAVLCVSSCVPPVAAEGIDVVSSATFSGTINDELFEGSSGADFNTVDGGDAECTFTSLPRALTPATTAPHT
jgi:hypothetical protein